MIFKSDGQAVIVIAKEVHERGFDLRAFLIDLGVTRATRAAHNVDYTLRKFSTGGEEFRSIPVIELQSPVRQFTPGVGLGWVQVCFVDRLETQMIDVPGFPTRRAENIHVWSPSNLICCRNRRGEMW